MHVTFDSRSDPTHYFTHFDALNNTMRALNVGKTPDQLLSDMIRKVPKEYSVP